MAAIKGGTEPEKYSSVSVISLNAQKNPRTNNLTNYY